MIKRKMLERQSLFGRKINSMAGYMNLESISKSVNHKDHFKPGYPEKWLGKKHQLSTSNINDVLKQYEKKHKHFKYYGDS